MFPLSPVDDTHGALNAIKLWYNTIPVLATKVTFSKVKGHTFHSCWRYQDNAELSPSYVTSQCRAT